MATYKRVVKAQDGSNMYLDTTANKEVPADKLSPALKEELDLADEGTEIDEDTITQGAGDGVEGKGAKGTEDEEGKKKGADKPATPQVDESPKNSASSAQRTVQRERNKTAPATDEEKAAGRRAFVSNTPQSEPGMGFPRKNGKTVDFFDGKTPHTHLRAIAGFLVPLSAENYHAKTDEEIYKKLVADGYINE